MIDGRRRATALLAGELPGRDQADEEFCEDGGDSGKAKDPPVWPDVEQGGNRLIPCQEKDRKLGARW
jgi:hypothetical protein